MGKRVTECREVNLHRQGSAVELQSVYALAEELEQEVERLRGLLAQQNSGDTTHRCRACYIKYKPVEGQSENCPNCGCDGTDAWMVTHGRIKGEGHYLITPKGGCKPYTTTMAPDSWELRECDIQWVPKAAVAA